LKAYCWHCHGAEERRADLDLRTLPLILRGGASGPAIVRGSSKESLIFRKFGDLAKHPPENSRPTEAHIATLRAWIDAGAAASYEARPVSAEESPPLSAADRSKWAFTTPVRPKLPVLSVPSAARTPIDVLLLQKLNGRGLSFSPPADRKTFIRRASFDLIGLPPTPEEVDAFVADPAPDASERLVDRLLASPHYGERWGRHWLDAAGYVDTRGTDNDAGIIEALDGIWKYRDYVIAAYNENRPYDRFLLEQLAGDELVDWRHADRYRPRDEELLIATGFLRQAADVTWAPELNTSDIRHQVLFDTVQIVSTNLMGLTVHCAQCHSHKFDPIAQADFYRVAGIFMPAFDPHRWLHSKERTLADVPPSQRVAIDAENAAIDRQLVSLKAEIGRLRRPYEEKLRTAKLAVVPKSKRASLQAALRTPAAGRNETQKALVAEFGRTAGVATADVERSLDTSAKVRQLELRNKIAALEKNRKSYGTIQALWDLGSAPPTYIYRRGDFRNPGPQIDPGVVAVLDDPRHPFRLPPRDKQHASTGYRKAFAKWLTSDRHPLTARVFVNRLWMHHFGRGIVATPENFGASGLPPSHPELVDWLAREFLSSGWNVKHLQRLIMTSAAYRQASESSTSSRFDGDRVDPDNILLWKMPLKRHESEIVRDAILATSGDLDPRMGGPAVPLKPNADGSVEIDSAKLRTPLDAGRRSVYLFARRNYQLSELGTFDQPVVATNCTCRNSSAVVSQSLALLNGRFTLEQARVFARRVERTAPADSATQIATTFRLALGRLPSADETKLATQLLREQAAHYRADAKTQPSPKGRTTKPEPTADNEALADLCQMLLNTNEFLYAQ